MLLAGEKGGGERRRTGGEGRDASPACASGERRSGDCICEARVRFVVHRNGDRVAACDVGELKAARLYELADGLRAGGPSCSVSSSTPLMNWSPPPSPPLRFARGWCSRYPQGRLRFGGGGASWRRRAESSMGTDRGAGGCWDNSRCEEAGHHLLHHAGVRSTACGYGRLSRLKSRDAA